MVVNQEQNSQPLSNCFEKNQTKRKKTSDQIRGKINRRF